jgi:hypothetical protein
MKPKAGGLDVTRALSNARVTCLSKNAYAAHYRRVAASAASVAPASAESRSARAERNVTFRAATGARLRTSASTMKASHPIPSDSADTGSSY